MIIPARSSVRPPGAAGGGAQYKPYAPAAAAPAPGTGTMKKNFAELLSDVNEIGTLSRSQANSYITQQQQAAAVRLPPPPASTPASAYNNPAPAFSSPARPTPTSPSGSHVGPARGPANTALPQAKPASMYKPTGGSHIAQPQYQQAQPVAAATSLPRSPYTAAGPKQMMLPPPPGTSYTSAYEPEPEPEYEPEPQPDPKAGGTVLTAAIKVMKQKKLEEIAEREAAKANKPAPNSGMFMPQLRKVDSPAKKVRLIHSMHVCTRYKQTIHLCTHAHALAHSRTNCGARIRQGEQARAKQQHVCAVAAHTLTNSTLSLSPFRQEDAPAPSPPYLN